ncbi:MAG TPA: nucleotidyltransferase family protein [bacterium]
MTTDDLKDRAVTLDEVLCRLGGSESAPGPAWPEDEPAGLALIDALRPHGLLPMLRRTLERSGARVPESVRRVLRADAAAVAAKSLLLTAELTRILDAASAEEVSCLPLRGPALAAFLHGDIESRPAGDLDFLVPRHELAAFAALLGALGYQAIDRRRGFAAALSYQMEFVRRDPAPLIAEPRWTIAYPPFTDTLDMDAVWARTQRAALLGRAVPCLGDEDLVLHLALHLRHHGDAAPLLWMYELDLMIRRRADAFRWDVLEATARRAGCGRVIAGVLDALSRRMGTPIPGPALARLREAESGCGTLARRVAERATVPGRETLAAWLALRGWRGKLRYAAAILVPSSEFMMLHYGLCLRRELWVWYPRRLWRLALGTVRALREAARPASSPRTPSRLAQYAAALRRHSRRSLLGRLRSPFPWAVDLGSPNAQIARTTAHYEGREEVAYAVADIDRGLDAAEKGLIEGPMARRGRVLVLGCGAGREALALAARGYEVTGVDIAPPMIEAARTEAARRGHRAEFLIMAAHQAAPTLERFDYLFAGGNLYSLLPSRALRARALSRWAALLTPGGALLLNAVCPVAYRPGLRADAVDVLRRLRRALPGGGRVSEPGDRLEGSSSPVSDPARPIFVHVFKPADVERELESAGFVPQRLEQHWWLARPSPSMTLRDT